MRAGVGAREDDGMTTAVRAGIGAGMFGELSAWRGLLWSLTWRDVRVRYKQSLLGIAWAILQPLSMMLVFTFVFTRAIDARSILSVDMPYALYAYLGLVPWTFFSTSLTGCVNALVANRNLVTKVYFPREVFPLSCVAGSFVDFLIAMTVLVGLGAYFHLSGRWMFVPRPALWFLPVVLLVQIVLTVGIGMVLAMANLFYRDVRPIVSVGLQLWMFVSAVVVPVPKDGSLLATVIGLNPLVPIIEGYRDCVVYGRLPQTGPFLYATITAAAALIGGSVLFRRASFKFAECI
ncbi:MAG: ABC transporter permease [Planctomycetota bacterium]|nr:MAG: ABC transporter permease [Planctomycetota bacterium]